MLSFVQDDLGSIILIVVLLAIVGLIIFYMIRKHKKGGSCGCNCGCCGKSGNCKTEAQNKKLKEEMIEQVNLENDSDNLKKDE